MNNKSSILISVDKVCILYLWITETVVTNGLSGHHMKHMIDCVCMDGTLYVTGFAKRGLIHTSNFATLMCHNFVCD